MRTELFNYKDSLTILRSRDRYPLSATYRFASSNRLVIIKLLGSILLSSYELIKVHSVGSSRLLIIKLLGIIILSS